MLKKGTWVIVVLLLAAAAATQGHVFVTVPPARGFSPGMDVLALAGELKNRYALNVTHYPSGTTLLCQTRLPVPVDSTVMLHV